MAFFLTKDLSDEEHDDPTSAPFFRAFRRYQEYLASKKEIFPRSAHALATSDWYYGGDDHRSPHDAWLESFLLTESSSGRRHQTRKTSLTVRLLGAYHDGYIELRYPKVFAYQLGVKHAEYGHHDWHFDEFRLSDEGHVIHEIEWWTSDGTSNWLIEASDVRFKWIPAPSFQSRAAPSQVREGHLPGFAGYSGQTTDQLIALEGTHGTASIALAFEKGLVEKAGRLGKTELSDEEIVVLAIAGFDQELDRGGFSEFFTEESKEYTPIILNALARIG